MHKLMLRIVRCDEKEMIENWTQGALGARTIQKVRNSGSGFYPLLERFPFPYLTDPGRLLWQM